MHVGYTFLIPLSRDCVLSPSAAVFKVYFKLVIYSTNYSQFKSISTGQIGVFKVGVLTVFLLSLSHV